MSDMSGNMKRLSVDPASLPEETPTAEPVAAETGDNPAETSAAQPEVNLAKDDAAQSGPKVSIEKPTGSDILAKFKVNAFESGGESVETLLTALPHYRISEAKDWTRLHPHDAYCRYWWASMFRSWARGRTPCI
jgi:hypothetical protein